MSYGVCCRLGDCIAGGSMEHIRWPLVQDQKPRKVASSLDPFKGVSGALPACQGGAGPYNMASGATWEVQGGPCTARLAGEDIRWCLVQARTPLKKRLVHERLLARPELHGCCSDVIQCSCTAAAAILM